MAPLAPFRGDVSSTSTSGINDVIGVNGTIGIIGDPLEQMAIYWCFIDANDVIGPFSNIGVPMMLMEPLVPMLPMSPRELFEHH